MFSVMVEVVLLLLSVLTLICPGSAVFNLIHADKAKCFYVEEPADTPLAFTYNIMDADHTLQFELYRGMVVDENAKIMVKTLKSGKSHIDYNTKYDGFHTLCFTQYPSQSVPTRLDLSIDFGHDKEYYDQLVKDQNMEPLNLEVRKINDEMILILNEADYQKHKEIEYHEQTVAMNQAAMWFPMIQIGILVVAAFFQVRHLKYFFKANKSM